MRFMLMDIASKESESGDMPSDEVMAAMGEFMDEAIKSGVLLSTEGLHPSAMGTRVRVSGDSVNVTDGPFTSTISDFALIEVGSKNEAVEWATRWLRLFGEGEAEIRQIVEESDLPH